MKAVCIVYWVTTILIVLFEGVMPALTSQTEMAKAGIRHLGYPDYFGVLLVIFKVGGSILLVVPQVPSRVKEWAYAGFSFDFIFASYSCFVVDGFGFSGFMPLLVFAVLITSYICYHRLKRADEIT